MVNIIFDSAITGHHTEYISHLIDIIINNPSNEKYIFVVPKNIMQKFPDLIIKSKNSEQIIWDYIEDEDVESLYRYSIIKRSFKEYETLNSFAVKHNADLVYLLYFNIFQLSLIFKRPKYKIIGILFLQFYRMEINSWKDKLKYYKKYITTKLYILNPCIHTIFILNDTKTVNFLNSKLSCKKFEMIPDPVPQYVEEKGFDVYDYYKIQKNKKILLHPGSIDPRKGTYEIIDSVDYFQNSSANEFVILIVGRARAEVDKEIKKRISILKNKSFVIVYDNTFVSNERLKSLFKQSFAVLIPYKNTEASSGILGHAIAAGKPVLVSNTGLIGEIVEDNDAGVLINSITPQEIASAYSALQNCKVSNDVIQKYKIFHTEIKFASKLLKIAYENKR